MEYHTTKDGQKIKLGDLELSHLKNILNWIDRKAAQGLTVRYGDSSFAEDMWYDEETYYGEDARKRLNYYHYKAELEKRNKL
jgi:hypothetical protein